jgi:hypothetical protein
MQAEPPRARGQRGLGISRPERDAEKQSLKYSDIFQKWQTVFLLHIKVGVADD